MNLRTVVSLEIELNVNVKDKTKPREAIRLLDMEHINTLYCTRH